MVGMAKAKTTKAYTLRAATQDDLKAIMGLYNWAVNQTFATIDSEPLDAEEAQAWWDAHGKRSKLLVAFAIIVDMRPRSQTLVGTRCDGSSSEDLRRGNASTSAS